LANKKRDSKTFQSNTKHNFKNPCGDDEMRESGNEKVQGGGLRLRKESKEIAKRWAKAKISSQNPILSPYFPSHKAPSIKELQTIVKIRQNKDGQAGQGGIDSQYANHHSGKDGNPSLNPQSDSCYRLKSFRG
jgi:hypothetical protein